jgi:spore germination cell wall hydrolase CwlJ-like protein
MNAVELTNYWWLALATWREARGESLLGKALVATVIINRSQDSKRRWPRTIQGVVRQKKQFSSFNDDDPNSKLYPVESDISWEDSVKAVTTAIEADPPITDANHYCVTTINPPWADPTKITEVEGNHKFFLL